MSDYTHWHVGMRVVCVDACARAVVTRRFFGLYKQVRIIKAWDLTVGHVYTVAEINTGRNVATGERQVGINVKECSGSENGLFPASCFRPVQTRKTDISIFTAMLDKPHQPVEEYEEVPFQ